MDISTNDFQSIYRRYAYPLYREVFEDLKDIEATREIVYQVFRRLRDEGLEESRDTEVRIHAYQSEYVTAWKKAKLDVERVWYQMQNDEILGRDPAFRATMPEPEMVPEPEVMSEQVTGTEPEAAPAPEAAPESETAPEPQSDEEPLTAVATEAALIEDMLAGVARSTRRPRKIREVFPEEEETPEEPEAPSQMGEEAPAREEREAMSEEDVTSQKAGVWIWLCWILLAIAILAFAWVFMSLLMSAELVPFWDLGYQWFNENVIELFPLPTMTAG